jgi:hypothetical protein
MAALALPKLYTLRPGQNMRLNVCFGHRPEWGSAPQRPGPHFAVG